MLCNICMECFKAICSKINEYINIKYKKHVVHMKYK